MQILTKYKVALIQNAVFETKQKILEGVAASIRDCVQKECKVIFLGEFFNTIFETNQLKKNAEDFSDKNNRETYELMKQLSEEFQIMIIGGLPEVADGKLFNAALAFNDGKLVGQYRKCHLFDVDIPGGITHFESNTFGSGNDYCIFDSQYGRYGLGICYDIRFPIFSQVMRDQGCQVLSFPSAFNQTTGPLHWELLNRSRALDNQVYVASAQAARYYSDDPDYYQTWGHSIITDPMGRVLATCGSDPAVLIQEINLSLVDQVRKNIPTSVQKRTDLYQVSKGVK
ncbi:unnamed protein product [Paramecium octaurelia]|uniref:CN hydrolase domain-containing protein n=1 Tax=Paramecium octaurelia TaxID=43137 RepID=A0A8S1UB77_PAROT|nr:unnamed protein product [Paramecium octaurelia]